MIIIVVTVDRELRGKVDLEKVEEEIEIDLIEALQKQINFCKTHENYKCGIWVTSKAKSDTVIKVISNLLWTQKKLEIRNNDYESSARFPNGSFIKVVQANSTARGNRFNGGIVESIISKEVVDVIVLPCLKSLFIENRYDNNDNPMNRMYFVDISENDVIESAKYRPILYVTSSRGSGKSMGELKNMIDAVSCGYSIRSVRYNENIFEKEYECMFYENDYDRPVVEKELNGDKVLLYEAWGIPKNLITYSTEFINKTKQTYLNVSGKYEDSELGFENDINVHLFVDTKIYDGYEVHIEDGMVSIILHEIKNEAPVLKDYGVA